jgi:heme exporter protein D
MDGLGEFFAMGGYAGYVWPAFGIVLTVMALLWITSVRGWNNSERTLTSLRDHRRRREASEE